MLTDRSRQLIQDADQRLVSSISISEIEIKRSIAKLTIPDSYLEKIIESGFDELPFDFEDAFGLRSLPLHHNDSFDRMLISQAAVKGLTILANDTSFRRYNIPVVLNE
ncbi:MAG: PIN domain-containing protein [Spirochaetaceae bacterium]|nr:MAG: PIN domain-containing protein [Spirochaetaceae bacterium]